MRGQIKQVCMEHKSVQLPNRFCDTELLHNKWTMTTQVPNIVQGNMGLYKYVLHRLPFAQRPQRLSTNCAGWAELNRCNRLENLNPSSS